MTDLPQPLSFAVTSTRDMDPEKEEAEERNYGWQQERRSVNACEVSDTLKGFARLLSLGKMKGSMGWDEGRGGQMQMQIQVQIQIQIQI